jgi:hypothetical protein
MGQQVGSLSYGDLRAEIYDTNIPGEFKVAYRDSNGKMLEWSQLAGISTYRQREDEILARLRELAEGAPPKTVPDLGDWGEY